MALIDEKKVVSGTLTSMKSAAMDVLDDLTHMAFGTDNTTPDVSDTALGGEVVRNAFDETPLESLGAGTYDFSGIVSLTQGNGNTLQEVGLFNASASGTMRLRALLPVAVSKTSSKEVSCGIRITVAVENV